MDFEFILHRPRIVDFNKKTGEPYGYEPEVTTFKANSGTHAMNLAKVMYKQTGLGFTGHFNVSRVS